MKIKNITPVNRLDFKKDKAINVRCAKCDKIFEGISELICADSACPVKLRNSFEIENLDPDKRTWYYDGYGVKRKKE